MSASLAAFQATNPDTGGAGIACIPPPPHAFSESAGAAERFGIRVLVAVSEPASAEREVAHRGADALGTDDFRPFLGQGAVQPVERLADAIHPARG